MDEDTHDPGWDPPYDLGVWPDESAGELEWIKYALRLLANEIDCTIRHVDRGERRKEDGEAGHSDYVDAALHLANIAAGLAETAGTLFNELLDDDEKITTTLHSLEKKLGVPMRVEIVNGMAVFTADEVVVPDNLEGLGGL